MSFSQEFSISGVIGVVSNLMKGSMLEESVTIRRDFVQRRIDRIAFSERCSGILKFFW